jgi:hypothetical protein
MVFKTFKKTPILTSCKVSVVSSNMDQSSEEA